VEQPDGTPCPAIVIVAGGEQEWRPDQIDPDPLRRPGAELMDRIRRAGIVQPGRETRSLAALIGEAGAPHGYVSATGTPLSRPIRAIAVRMLDEDPHLATLWAAAREADQAPEDVLLGVQVLKRVTGADQVCFVLGARQALPGLEALADEHAIRLMRIPGDRYPAASDVWIARDLLGREPDVETHAVHVSGALVVDVDVVEQVARAAREQRPVIDRILTVRTPRGSAVVRARVGTPLRVVLEAAGLGDLAGAAKLVVGGPMRGMAHHRTDFPVTRGCGALSVQLAAEVKRARNDPCVSCGLCVDVCPMRLVPGMLSRYSEFGQWDRAAEFGLFTCIECGSCAWVCPARRSMVQLMVHAKSEVLAARRPS